MNIALTVIALGLPIWLAIWATSKVVADEFAERGQKIAQLALVWLVPILGALCVLAVHRKEEKPSRSYRQDVDAGDDYAMSGTKVRKVVEALDDD